MFFWAASSLALACGGPRCPILGFMSTPLVEHRHETTVGLPTPQPTASSSIPQMASRSDAFGQYGFGRYVRFRPYLAWLLLVAPCPDAFGPCGAEVLSAFLRWSDEGDDGGLSAALVAFVATQ